MGLADMDGDPGRTLRREVNVLEAGRFNIRLVDQAFKRVPIELIRPGFYQTRRNFKPRALRELSVSMAATGSNITPLIVRPIKFGVGFEIIAGERRWRAAQMAGMDSLICCVGSFSDDQALYISGADNLQREDLNPIEEAESYDLMIQTGMTHLEVASEIGKSRTHVTNYVRLLSLPLIVRDMLGDERLSYAQARPICGLTAPGLQTKIALEAVSKQWPSKRIMDEVAKVQALRRRPISRELHGEDVNVRKLRDQIAEQTGYPCALIKTPSGGWQIGFNAASVEELQGILERLGVNTEML
jgi:ParB family chromosome partitioning protein